MPNKKTIDIKSLSKELESLIDITGDSCGPILIKELQRRMDKTIDTFNRDVVKILKASFELYQAKIDNCKEILNGKKIIDNYGDVEESESSSPKFIQLYEKKTKKKL